MVRLEVFRSRRGEKEKKKEKERHTPEKLPDRGPTPLEVAAARDEMKYQRAMVLEAAHIFPLPYGHVLVWRLVEGLPCREIRDRLNAHRRVGAQPVADRQAQIFISDAIRMFKERLANVDPRIAHRQKYLPKKNRWIGSPLPPLASQIQ
jgi:hypothetical protein